MAEPQHSSYSTHSCVLFIYSPSFKNHPHTDPTNPCLQFKSLHWAPDLDIPIRISIPTPTMESSASPYAHTMGLEHPSSCPRQGWFSLAHVHKYTHPSHLHAYLPNVAGLLLCLLVSYQYEAPLICNLSNYRGFTTGAQSAYQLLQHMNL